MAATATARAKDKDSAIEAFLDQIESRLAEAIEQIERSEVWRLVTSPKTDPALVKAIMREVYREIFSYQPHTVEAAFQIVGRMPKTETKLIKTLIHHYIEEIDHQFQAARDFAALGGDEKLARSVRISPASFAVAAVWRTLATIESPFTYLGILMPFEAVTPIVTEKVMAVFKQRGLMKDSQEFIAFHAHADVGHARLARQLIRQVVSKFPEAREAIQYGMDCFLHVYPLPVWNEALRRAQASLVDSQ